VLNYGSTPATKPVYPPKPLVTLPNTTRGFLDDLAPLYPSADYPTFSEVTRRITLTVHQKVDGQTVWLQDGYNWTDNFVHEPYLVSLYKNDRIEFPSIARALTNGGIDPVTRSFPAELGEVLEIVIQNTGADSGGLDSHPFHAHGSHFWDLGSGNGTYNSTANDLKWDNLGHQPPLRDTSMLYRYASGTGNGTVMGWRAWRLRVTEPGVWMVHCHILQHMVMGMQTVWVFGDETELLGRVGYPEVDGYLTYGGDVYGNATHAPEMVHFKDNDGVKGWSEDQRLRV
jgi:L-ascorbate oxidase